MVNEEVLGGLISGLERGESLQKAMMTLFNAGYKKEEIEEAAQMATKLGIQSKYVPAVVKKEKVVLDTQEKQPYGVINQSQVNPQTFASPIQAPSQAQIKQANQPPSLTSTSTKRQSAGQKTVQKASNYVDNGSKEKMMIFLLVALLVFLVGVLVAIFMFKDDLINFFSTFF